jgi:hypothetical protein
LNPLQVLLADAGLGERHRGIDGIAADFVRRSLIRATARSIGTVGGSKEYHVPFSIGVLATSMPS